VVAVGMKELALWIEEAARFFLAEVLAEFKRREELSA
jgi:hypothetical protein